VEQEELNSAVAFIHIAVYDWEEILWLGLRADLLDAAVQPGFDVQDWLGRIYGFYEEGGM
jgi:hypothetical protein